MAQTTTITAIQSAYLPDTLVESPGEKQNALVTKVGHEGGPRRLHLIPSCATLEELLEREKRHMAAAFRIFAKLGFADGASGHISLRGKNW